MFYSIFKFIFVFIIKLPVKFYIVVQYLPVVFRQGNHFSYPSGFKYKKNDQYNQSQNKNNLKNGDHKRMKLSNLS